jgi:hypothetical protein
MFPSLSLFSLRYASRLETVVRRARESGRSLSLPSSAVEEAVLGVVPSLAELQRCGVDVFAQEQPLLMQFLAWQRLMQIRQNSNNKNSNNNGQQK